MTAGLEMQETESVPPSDPFRQGDIIRLIDNDERELDPPYGIINNADCDLVHRKTDGIISYLPLFPFQIYFQKFWIPSFIDARRRELLDAIAKACNLEAEKCAPLEDWVREEEPKEICARLVAAYSVKESVVKPRLLELTEIARASVFDWETLNNIIRIQGLDRDDALKRYAIRALKTLGDGHFFLNEVYGLSSVGFVARMRRTHAINSENVFTSISQFKLAANRENLYGIRISRLTNLYRFKVAQLFAYQFSRIGLPDEITALNEIAVQAALTNMGGDFA